MEITTLIIIITGIFLGFFIQTIIGFGGTLVSLPILLIVLEMPNAIAYISLFYFISSIVLISKERVHIQKRIIIKLAFTSIIGVGIGVLILMYANPVFLKRALGLFIIAYVLYSQYAKKEMRVSSKIEYVFGFLGGLFSGLFSTGGPLYVIVVKNATPNIKIFRATMFGVLGLITLVRIPMLVAGGIIKLNHLYTSLFILPFFFLALFLGKKMYQKLNEIVIKKIISIMLLCSGLLLLIKS
jgi:uncharacterized membrane protein YfcA